MQWQNNVCVYVYLCRQREKEVEMINLEEIIEVFIVLSTHLHVLL